MTGQHAINLTIARCPPVIRYTRQSTLNSRTEGGSGRKGEVTGHSVTGNGVTSSNQHSLASHKDMEGASGHLLHPLSLAPPSSLSPNRLQARRHAMSTGLLAFSSHRVRRRRLRNRYKDRMGARKGFTVTPAPSLAGAQKQGLGMGMTGFFLIAQMAGAGFLALPRALADTGWLGIVMLPLFCVSVAFVGTRLGKSWVILEERWPQVYKGGARQPYMEIGYRSMGRAGRVVTRVCVLVKLFGTTTVHLILMAEMVAEVVQQKGGLCLTKCHLILIVAACLVPLTWLGTPKDLWQASLLAVAATLVAVVVIVVQIFMAQSNGMVAPPVYPNPSLYSFSLGFGSILFAFGGAAVFPTIQNDMRNREKFWQSVVLGFTGLITLYLPVALSGYLVIGDAVKSNILLSVKMTTAVVVAIAMQTVNLLCTFLLSSNPVYQAMEEVCGVGKRFGVGRCVLRTVIVVTQILIGLAVPNFGTILNLIGGSLITICTFVLPPVMYMRLVNDTSDKSWPKRSMPLFKTPFPPPAPRSIPPWERVVLVEAIVVGVVGGILSTLTAAYDLVETSFKSNCFTDFNHCGKD
ncbi:Amino acid transporter AVT1D [Chionoecetes opilio]|uniref:Amino acid transporter AVT1D n=1 Tax=Chionoecetes opilio TaxID=41210 RepID=A0A8J5CZM6_CHIOP|nr:Amino acid transporter AVT1D [Chionoecetes opilio]